MDYVDIDRWLANPQVQTRHRRVARVAPDHLWHAAESVRVADAPAFGRVLRWRIPGTPPELAFRDVLRRYPFVVLAEADGWSISGLCGAIWSIRRDYPRLEGPDAFDAWGRPGSVRVVLAHWVEPDKAGSAIVSEARIEPVDRAARIRTRLLWASLGHFERLIGGEVLSAAVRAANRAPAPGQPADVSFRASPRPGRPRAR
jgi:hypothetical protein